MNRTAIVQYTHKNAIIDMTLQQNVEMKDPKTDLVV